MPRGRTSLTGPTRWLPSTLLALVLALFFGQAAMASGGGNPLDDVMGHVFHRTVYVPLEIFGVNLSITNHLVWMILSAILLSLIMVLAAKAAARQGTVPRGLRNLLELIIVFFQENFILKYFHKKEDADRYTPYLLSSFFFIATMNILGMIPGSSTPTSHFCVTAGLATMTLFMMLTGGMREQGIGGFWVNLIPHGVPTLLKPLLFVIEVIGLFAKIFALTVRLFANMTAGHTILFVLVAFIIAFKQLFYVVIPASVAGAVAISCLEVFVAFLQAYIFTFLSAVFIGAALHPEH